MFQERFDFDDETRISLTFQERLRPAEEIHKGKRISAEFVNVERCVLFISLLLDSCLIQPKLWNNARDLNFFTLKNIP